MSVSQSPKSNKSQDYILREESDIKLNEHTFLWEEDIIVPRILLSIWGRIKIWIPDVEMHRILLLLNYRLLIFVLDMDGGMNIKMVIVLLVADKRQIITEI